MNVQSKHKSFGQQHKKTLKRKKVVMPFLQRIGKSLLFPIAILPFAAIFLRISAMIPPDVSPFADLVAAIFSTVGNAVFGPVLPILFAIAIAFGMSKDQRGEAAIVGFVIMILLQLFLGLPGQGLTGSGINLVDTIYGAVQTNPDGSEITYGFAGENGLLGDATYTSVMVNNVLNGIVVGILVAFVYNKFNGLELPSVLGFFSGRRLIPVLSLIFGMIFSIFWAIIFPWVAWCIYFISQGMGEAVGNRYANAGIMSAYGFFNRLLIPFGLHHIPNTLFWFTDLGGSFTNANGEIIVGDINIFLQGDVYSSTSGFNNSGTFQSGFFPIMMFGLPTFAFAFYKFSENKVQASRVVALLFGSAMVSFFTGITEPIEFSFMFLSPMIYLMHAGLTGFWGLIVGLFGIQLGFGFSAGLIDYALSIPKSLAIISAKTDGVFENGLMIAAPIYSKIEGVMANPLWLFPIGGLTSLSYFYGTKFMIKYLHAAAPGISPNLLNASDESMAAFETPNLKQTNKYTKDGLLIIKALGKNNIETVEWCSTRLRILLKDNANINGALVKQTTSRGEIKIGSTGYQIIIGPTVEMLGNEISRLLKTNLNDLDKIKINNVLNDSKKIETKSLTKNIYSLGNGILYDLSSVKDQAFRTKLLGDGIVLDCLDGNIYSPVNGEISAIFPTLHAYGITTDDGVTILIHIGIDTSILAKGTFSPAINIGDKVVTGQLICHFNRELIIQKKLDHRVILVVTPESSKQIMSKSVTGEVTKELIIIRLKDK